LVRSEDFRKRLEELVQEGRDAGRRAETEAIRAGAEALRLPDAPDLEQPLLDSLQAVMEAEVIVAKPAAGEAVIERNEQDREISKRALMHIRLPQLRVIAEGLGGRRGGGLEDVLERIVRAYGSDQEKIARLVVEYEAEPPPERRWTTRLFHLTASEPDLTSTATRAELFTRRYMRTGVARWFVIDDLDWSWQRLSMSGTFRYYKADATQEDDEYRLVANAADAPARLRLEADQTSVEVDARGPTESRAIMAAFQHATGLRWRKEPPFPGHFAAGELLRWDVRSVFFLDLLSARFRSDAIEIFDLRSAGFQAATGPELSSQDDDQSPAIKSIRLEGRYLFDSKAACEQLVAGQALIELGLVIRFRPSAEQDVLIAVTIRQERDHTTVMTAYGVVDPAVARQLHLLLIEGVRQTFERGLRDSSALERVAAEIRKRAAEETPVRRPTIFPPGETSSSPGESAADIADARAEPADAGEETSEPGEYS
jgi:hypothetical protein